jgi:hypothetical protein
MRPFVRSSLRCQRGQSHNHRASVPGETKLISVPGFRTLGSLTNPQGRRLLGATSSPRHPSRSAWPVAAASVAPEARSRR